MKISARKQLIGTVISISEGQVNAKVTIDIGGGNQITSIISLEAVADLELKAGSEVTAVVKATSVLLMA
jgi:molybdopterin-binding protein